MKKLLVFALLLSAMTSATAQAGRMDEIVIMADESIYQTLNLTYGGDDQVEFHQRGFVQAEPFRDLAVETKLTVTNVPTMNKQEWTCATQFVKTPKFFKVSETFCK